MTCSTHAHTHLKLIHLKQQQRLKNDFPQKSKDEIKDKKTKKHLHSVCKSSPNCFSCLVADFGAGENFFQLLVSNFQRNRNIFEAVGLRADVKLSYFPLLQTQAAKTVCKQSGNMLNRRRSSL